MKSQITIALLLLLCCQCYSKDDQVKDVFEEYKRSHHLQCVDSLYVYNFVTESKSTIKSNISKTYFWYHNGSIHSSAGSYTGKLLKGEYVKMMKNGRMLVEKGYFEGGLKTGPWYNWNLDGTLSLYVEYKEGERNGKYIQYADDNQYAVEGKYKKGLKSKKWSNYENGHLISTSEYKNGALNGRVVEYDTLGNKLRQQKFRNDKLDGVSYTYEGKNVVSKEKYKDGVLVPKKEKKTSVLKKLVTTIFKSGDKAKEKEKEKEKKKERKKKNSKRESDKKDKAKN